MVLRYLTEELFWLVTVKREVRVWLVTFALRPLEPHSDLCVMVFGEVELGLDVQKRMALKW